MIRIPLLCSVTIFKRCRLVRVSRPPCNAEPAWAMFHSEMRSWLGTGSERSALWGHRTFRVKNGGFHRETLLIQGLKKLTISQKRRNHKAFLEAALRKAIARFRMIRTITPWRAMPRGSLRKCQNPLPLPVRAGARVENPGLERLPWRVVPEVRKRQEQAQHQNDARDGGRARRPLSLRYLRQRLDHAGMGVRSWPSLAFHAPEHSRRSLVRAMRQPVEDYAARDPAQAPP